MHIVFIVPGSLATISGEASTPLTESPRAASGSDEQ